MDKLRESNLARSSSTGTIPELLKRKREQEEKERKEVFSKAQKLNRTPPKSPNTDIKETGMDELKSMLESLTKTVQTGNEKIREEIRQCENSNIEIKTEMRLFTETIREEMQKKSEEWRVEKEELKGEIKMQREELKAIRAENNAAWEKFAKEKEEWKKEKIELINESTDIRKTINYIEKKKVNDLENHNRRENIVVKGVKETTGEKWYDCKKSICEIAAEIGVAIDERDIVSVNRIGRDANHGFRPILVKFSD